MNRPVSIAVVALLLMGAAARPVHGDDQPIMPFADVRIGMKGYGMTVFHGTKIEPFPLEVISTVSDSTPKRGTIWVRCTDERMQLSGPVQGMSGSPIYLWDEGEDGIPGEGGRLVGAFAFGYGLSKDCIVGVQPIELMRDIAQRKDDAPAEARRGSWDASHAVLTSLHDVAQQRGAAAHLTRKLDRLRELAGDAGRATHQPIALSSTHDDDAGRGPRPLMLPLNVGSRELASALAPLYRPMGLAPVAGGTLAGPPPVGIDPDAVSLSPGSVLVVPLVFGDLDLAASGTVTDVLDDGTVLGFGHAMFSEGATALPMATGYVHFILPSLNISFKRTGTLRMAGSLLRDEETGVLGADVTRYTTAPVEITVEHVEGEPETFTYEVVNYRPLAPQIAATVVLQSIAARHSVPFECTIDFEAEMAFEGGRTFKFSSILAGADLLAPAYEVLPILAMMTENPFESLRLESMRASVKVRRGVDAATIVTARVDHAEVAPGGTVRVTLVLQPQDAPRFSVSGEITVPRDTPEGDYPLLIGGGQTYTRMLSQTRPHRNAVTSIDDLATLINEIYAIPNEGIYLMLPRDAGGIAVGRTELPHVPSSRAAMLASPTHNFVTPYNRLDVSRIDTPLTILSQTALQLSVRKGAHGSQP